MDNAPVNEEFVLTEELAMAIEKLVDMQGQLDNSRLTKRAILLLLKDITGMGINDLNTVLNAIPMLEKTFLKPKKKEPTK